LSNSPARRCVKQDSRKRTVANITFWRRYFAALARDKQRTVNRRNSFMRAALLTIAAIAAFSSAAFATDGEGPACAVSRPVTARLVADAGELKALGGRSDILIGNLSYMREPQEEAEAASGTVLFVKGAGGWRAIVPSNWENEVGVYVAANSRGLAILTQRQVGDPGQSFTFVRTGDDFATSTCAEIAFPAALNQPTWNGEFLTPHDLDLKANGRGMLVASASLERSGEQPRTLWFSYETRDNGRTWRTPRALPTTREAPRGQYAPATLAPAPALVAELTAYAVNR
jgi:hypothetical protein